MAPIRWAASAPLLPPLRHLTRSIVRCNGECVSEFTQQRRIRLSMGADHRGRVGFIGARLRAGHAIGRHSSQGATWLSKKHLWNTIPYPSKFLSTGSETSNWELSLLRPKNPWNSDALVTEERVWRANISFNAVKLQVTGNWLKSLKKIRILQSKACCV